MDQPEECPNHIGGPARGVPEYDRLRWNHPEQQLQTTSASQCPHDLYNWGEQIDVDLPRHNQFHLVDISNMLRSQAVSGHCLDDTLGFPILDLLAESLTGIQGDNIFCLIF